MWIGSATTAANTVRPQPLRLARQTVRDALMRNAQRIGLHGTRLLQLIRRCGRSTTITSRRIARSITVPVRHKIIRRRTDAIDNDGPKNANPERFSYQCMNASNKIVTTEFQGQSTDMLRISRPFLPTHSGWRRQHSALAQCLGRRQAQGVRLSAVFQQAARGSRA